MDVLVRCTDPAFFGRSTGGQIHPSKKLTEKDRRGCGGPKVPGYRAPSCHDYSTFDDEYQGRKGEQSLCRRLAPCKKAAVD